LTDAASFKAGHSLLNIKEISPDLEEKMEAGFIGYFRALARPSSARQVHDDADPNVKLWLLKPDEIRSERLPGLQEAEGGVVAEHRGTCQRGIARERRGIEFFSVGNSVFDSIASVAMDRLTGRVFGIAVQSHDHQSGSYLYVGGRAVADDEAVDARVALRRRTRAVFFGRHSSAVFELGHEAPLSPSSLDELIARALGNEVQARDLGREKLQSLIEASQVDWGEYLVRMQPVMRNELQMRIEARHGQSFRSALESIDRERKELMRSYLDATEEALSNLDSVARAIRDWGTVIDVIGVVNIHP
jgi:hypothetical protein